MKNLKIAFLLFAAALFTVSCSDDDNPVIVNEEEVITKMVVEFVPVGGGNRVVVEVNDPDGDGPIQPVATDGILVANTTYNANITLLDESNPNDIENITEEVEEEDDEHQFFFATTGNIGTITYLDFDANNNPVGLNFSLETLSATSGTLTVTLRHEPIKDAAGVSNGDITNAGGETDIQATFNISVQ
ncbi:type 1 periplasmic binding fold superfamily protein [Winogradskyella litorisediminis]|uniref:Type 1 periplasmic binding fold superfamily protein n=1 Tax=Winogradskyella litorisediminis TaxID=1156618 RepID=A0ABW3N213_9FLAO